MASLTLRCMYNKYQLSALTQALYVPMSLVLPLLNAGEVQRILSKIWPVSKNKRHIHFELEPSVNSVSPISGHIFKRKKGLIFLGGKRQNTEPGGRGGPREVCKRPYFLTSFETLT